MFPPAETQQRPISEDTDKSTGTVVVYQHNSDKLPVESVSSLAVPQIIGPFFTFRKAFLMHHSPSLLLPVVKQACQPTVTFIASDRDKVSSPPWVITPASTSQPYLNITSAYSFISSISPPLHYYSNSGIF